MSKSISSFVNNIANNSVGKVVVEIGAGKGLVKDIQHISDNASSFIGIDPSNNISQNPYLHSYEKINFENCRIENNSVDIVYSIYVMEHIYDPTQILSRAFSVLKPGGKFYAITVNKQHYFAFVSTFFDKLNIKKMYIEKIMNAKYELAFGFKTYYKFNCYADVYNKMTKHNFKNINVFEEIDNTLLDYYFPKYLKPIPYLLSTAFSGYSLVKNVLIIEAEK